MACVVTTYVSMCKLLTTDVHFETGSTNQGTLALIYKTCFKLYMQRQPETLGLSRPTLRHEVLKNVSRLFRHHTVWYTGNIIQRNLQLLLSGYYKSSKEMEKEGTELVGQRL